MPTFPTQTYNMMLQSVLFNITPALPSGTAGTRALVGEPEHIPEVTFITRTVSAADHIGPDAEPDRLNGYIEGGIAYHEMYGLIPGDPPSSNDFIIGSIEEILEHFNGSSETIDRIRLVSHGNDSFLFVPLFNDGSWFFGIQTERLEAFRSSDEEGIRFLISGDKSMVIDGLSTIVSGVRAIDDSLLEPFGIKNSGMPDPGDATLFFQLVNDYFQVENGTLLEQTNHDPPTPSDPPPPPTFELIDSTQKGHMITALDFLKEKVKQRLIGTTVDSIPLTGDYLDDLQNGITSLSPTELGFMGPVQNLGASVLSDLGTAMGTTPHVEGDLRNAIVGHTGEPMFQDNKWGLIEGLKLFHPDSLKLGPSDSIEITPQSDLSSVPDLESYFDVCSDLFFMEHGPVSIDGTAVTNAQRNTLKNGLRAITAIIRDRIVSGSSGITDAELNTIRTRVEGLTIRQAGISGNWKAYYKAAFPDMSAAVASMEDGFRTKIDHFRSLINSDSTIDIRGCLVGSSPDYLDDLRTFFGTFGNLPDISAPDWYQSFPAGAGLKVNASIFNDIDSLVQNGIPSEGISATDVTISFSEWKNLINFDDHFTFITELFDGTTSRFDFATLEWKTWRSSGSTTGIPMLRMEAERIDDLVGLNLGEIIERFRVIFDISSGNAPDATERTQLDALQPHLVTFKSLTDTVSSTSSATSTQLTGFFNNFSTLAGRITGISGMPTPSSPLVPATAPSSLQLSHIQTYITDIQNYIDDYLDDTFGDFFTAVFDPGPGNGVIENPNAEIRYYFNIGLPLLAQSSVDPAHPPSSNVSVYMSASSSSQPENQVAKALRSWMRIQWTGSAAQASAMNTRIDNVSIGTDAERIAVSRVSRLSDKDPSENEAEAEINPMPGFESHIIKRPII